MWLHVRASIHMSKYTMTRQCIVQLGVEEHMQNCENDLGIQWHTGTYWCMWFAEATIWYGYSLCYSNGLVMCTAKEVVYLFTWRLFSIFMLRGIARIFNLGGPSYSIYTIIIIHKYIEYKVINSNISINFRIHYRHT